MTSCRLKEISFIAIKLNLEFVSMFQKKNHSNTTEVHESTQTDLDVMQDKCITIIATLMEIELCQIRGQDSRSSRY